MTENTEETTASDASGSARDLAAPSMLIPALAALVMRQARGVLVERKMIAGVSRTPGSAVGLTAEDRAAMALVSRESLRAGLPDRGAEIHDLLWQCTRPLGEWLSVRDVVQAGLAETRLLLEEDGVPSVEAEELAKGFGSMTAGLEEQLFQRFTELLNKYPSARAEHYYTLVREFVVRHPVVRITKFQGLARELPAQLFMQLQNNFYEAVPEAWETRDGVPLCAHCGNAMRMGKAALVCRTAACAATRPAATGGHVGATEGMRAVRALKQYWIEPGVDELRLFDRIKAMGLAVTLYPKRDAVDIAVGDVGIDLKAYSSPEILGRRFRRDIGGLALYREKWVVIPDITLEITPSYLTRLAAAAGRSEIQWLSVSQAAARLQKAANA